MQCNDVVLLVLILGLIAPWSKLQGMAIYFRETMPKICKLPPRYGWCKESFQNFYYDFKSRICRTFTYSGCRGNKNNFANLLECFFECQRFDLLLPWRYVVGNIQWYQETPKKCKLPVRKGWCKFALSHYYYDFKNKRCRPFIYGGCGGNQNNFRTFLSCARECEEFGKPNNNKPVWNGDVLLDTCEQPLDAGICKEAFPRFYYEASSNTCKAFNFGGCNGNRNNFLTEEDCIQECVKPG